MLGPWQLGFTDIWLIVIASSSHYLRYFGLQNLLFFINSATLHICFATYSALVDSIPAVGQVFSMLLWAPKDEIGGLLFSVSLFCLNGFDFIIKFLLSLHLPFLQLPFLSFLSLLVLFYLHLQLFSVVHFLTLLFCLFSGINAKKTVLYVSGMWYLTFVF